MRSLEIAEMAIFEESRFRSSALHSFLPQMVVTGYFCFPPYLFLFLFREGSRRSFSCGSTSRTLDKMHKSRIRPASRTAPRRSARACSGCRLRKVRCDVTKRGFPCNNCQSCNMPCSIPVDRRGKLATAAEKENVDGTTPSDNGLITVSKLGGCMGKCW